VEPNLASDGSALFLWATQKANADAAKYASCDAAVRWYVDQRVPTEKIVLGVPFYGQVWAGVPNANDGIYEPYSTRPGDDGTLSFREIEESYLPTYSRHWDEQSKVPWLYKKKDENDDQLRGLRTHNCEGEICNSAKPGRNEVLGSRSGRQQSNASWRDLSATRP
jgi:hypothetical protein